MPPRASNLIPKDKSTRAPIADVTSPAAMATLWFIVFNNAKGGDLMSSSIGIDNAMVTGGLKSSLVSYA